MSDERLRALERRWRASGAPEDEVAWLRARARAGDLAPEALALLRAPEHPATEALASELDLPSAPSVWADATAGLSALARPAVIRIGLAAASAALEATPPLDLSPEAEAELDPEELAAAQRGPFALWAALDAWALHPDDADSAAVATLAAATGEALTALGRGVAERWRPLEPERVEHVRREYAREIAGQSFEERPVRGLLPFACNEGYYDDYAGQALDAKGQPHGAVLTVHLTYSVERSPAFPAGDLARPRRWAERYGLLPGVSPGASAALWLGAPTLAVAPALNATLALVCAERALAPDALRAAVLREVAPWALGEADPVAARVAARSPLNSEERTA